jgi:3-oxoacyl-[acyl-carrier-protein] synthase II
MVALMNRRVVITGCGVICPLGRTKEDLWSGLLEGRSGVTPLTSLPSGALPLRFGGEVVDFTGKIDDFGPLDPNRKKTIRKGLKVMCREIQMGVASAQWALHDGQLDPASCDPDRAGVSFGADYIMTLPDEFATGVRDCLDETGDFRYERWSEKGMPNVTPLWLLKYLPNMPACHVAIYNDFRGPNNSITVREASANLAVAEAYSMILRGQADVMLAGATGSRIHPLRTVHTVLQEQLALEGDSPERASRPFDLHRQGMVVGEGAAVLLLEDAQAAEKRGVPVLGEVLGYGASAALDRQAVALRDRALKNAMIQALKSARMTPDDIGHVHAHGLSTLRCDIAEAQAIRDVFRDRKEPVPVTAAKSYFGNLGAAGGMVELVASMMAIQHGTLFPTLNYETPDPECPVEVVHQPTRPAGSNVLNLNVTPQGQASAVIVGRFKP